MRTTPLILALILIGSLVIKTNAATILNGSFENATSGLPDDWNPSGNLRVVNSQGQTDGSFALAFSFDNLPSDGQIWQTFVTVPLTTYNLSFDFGKYSVNQPDLFARLQVDIFDGAGFSGTVQVSKLVEDDTNMVSGFYNSFQYEFTALSASSTLRFQDFSDAQVPGGGFDAMLDKVGITAVPEPSTTALLIGGVALAAALRRRNQ